MLKSSQTGPPPGMLFEAGIHQHGAGSGGKRAVDLPALGAGQRPVARIGGAVADRAIEPDVVAEDQVALAAAVDPVAAGAADQDVFAAIAVDRVRHPVRPLHGGDTRHEASRAQAPRPGHLVDHAVIAEHDVVAGIAMNGVRAGRTARSSR